MALDYGARRTGVAVSDATGLVARPLCVVDRAATPPGLVRLAELAAAHEIDQVVIGLPLTLRGEHGEQALETEAFAHSVRAALDLPVELFDERFTTRIARQTHPGLPDDAVAAAHLLQSWLDRSPA